MDPTTLAERGEDLQIVDVRYPNEWDAGRIDGAIHISLDDLDDRLEEIDRSRRVVIVCRSGNRSASAAELLTAEGFRAESLVGGMEAWAAAGLPFTTPDGQPGTVAEPEPPPDDRPPEHQRLQAEFLSVLFDLQEHFGDHEPSEEEVRGFLRARLIGEGRSPEEADEFLARTDQQQNP